METQVKIILVDDNTQFRRNLRKFIEYKLNYNVIAEASDGLNFLELFNLHEADIILMDIAMENMDGFEATKRAVWQYNNCKIIAITMHIEKVFLLKLIQSGFKGIVFKANIFSELEKAIDIVLSGNLFFPNYAKLKLK